MTASPGPIRLNSISTAVLGQRLAFLMAVCIPLMSGLRASAQTSDLVVVRSPSNSETVNRRGTIVEWKGDSLTLEMQPSSRKIDNADIVSFQTLWPAGYREAQPLIARGRFEAAAAALAQAIKEESRPWARRHLRAELVRILGALNQWEAAVDQFLLIAAEDPQTQFFHLCPLKWLSSASLGATRSAGLLKSREPLEQLLGASWSIPGRDQAEGIKVLEQLTADLDPRIQKLAAAQLWRVRATNLSSINDRQLEAWESKLAELPEKLRAGPWYFIADLQMQRKQYESALINWMRIPILYPDQYSLSAAALHQSSLLLDNLGREEQSQALKDELNQKFFDTIWAKEAAPAAPER